jgi:hypothetical protein
LNVICLPAGTSSPVDVMLIISRGLGLLSGSELLAAFITLKLRTATNIIKRKTLITLVMSPPVPVLKT